MILNRIHTVTLVKRKGGQGSEISKKRQDANKLKLLFKLSLEAGRLFRPECGSDLPFCRSAWPPARSSDANRITKPEAP